MPEMQFRVRWSDGTTRTHYSPSLVMHDHLSVGASYPIAEFLRRARTGLVEASDRVQARWGSPCTAAMASLAEIEAVGAAHPAGARVTVLGMYPPLPAPGESTASSRPTGAGGGSR